MTGKITEIEQNGIQHPLNLICSYFPRDTIFIYALVPKYLNFETFSKAVLRISKL
jgi:hypothetical protein